jgi:hypothetical protein
MRMPEPFRWMSAPNGYESSSGDAFGIFIVPGRHANGRTLRVIACDGLETGWDHVSVSLADSPSKIPSWQEMCIIKDLFFDESDCVVQFHPPKEDYVNNHVGVLHLWRCIHAEFPMPPKICV